jgi:hypothetical protein
MASMQATSSTQATAAELLALVHGLAPAAGGWQAARLHGAVGWRIAPDEADGGLAACELAAALRRHGGRHCRLADGGLLLLWPEAAGSEFARLIERLRLLGSDDPPAAPARACERPFCHRFDLPAARAALLRLLQAEAGGAASPAAASRTAPLDPGRLAVLESDLASLDLAELLRWQAVCAGLPNSAPQRVASELHVAIGELAARLAPGVDLLADRWLFQRLAATLDRRVLALLAGGAGDVLPGQISLNLRVATLLAPELQAFDRRWRQPRGATVVIELQLVDVFAEFGAYLFAREVLRPRGYLFALDGVHHLHLPLLERRQLGADLVKLRWSPELLDQPGGRAELAAAIRRAGVERIVLCRCDGAAAIEWGHRLGIRLFQGRHVDACLEAAARQPPTPALRTSCVALAG